MRSISGFYIFAIGLALGMVVLALGGGYSSWAMCILIGLIGNEIVVRMDAALAGAAAVLKYYAAQGDKANKDEE